MTSTPVVLLLKRSGQSSDRPSGVVVQNGELAIAVGAADPGLYFEDSAGAIRKIGPNHYGATAPNSAPVGSPGNSVGETWADNTANHYFRVWTGSAWVKIGAGFADTATTATTATNATFATQSSTTVLASGAILASGSVQSNTATLASGAILASGALQSNTALLASGAILASGSVQSAFVYSSSLPASASTLSGVISYLATTSGSFPSGLYVRVADGWALI